MNKKVNHIFIFICVFSLITFSNSTTTTVGDVILAQACSAAPLDGISLQIIRTINNVYPDLL
jgi:hypothetical protein